MNAKASTTRRARHAVVRDQNESAFSAILADLIARIPGARAAALVDRDGETVDYAGSRSPYDLKVAAAHFRIALDAILSQPALTKARFLVVRASRTSFVMQALPHGYAIFLWLARGAGFRGLSRALPSSARRLADEAGWPSLATAWHQIDVVADARGAPEAIRFAAPRGRDLPVEVLGRFRNALPERERAWRVRISTGPEFTLVREANDFWYMDDLFADPSFKGTGTHPKKNL